MNDQTQQSKHIHDENISAVQSLKGDLLNTMQQHRDSTLQSQDKFLRTIGEQLAKLAQRSTALEKSERILESLYCEEVYSRELRVSDACDCTFNWAFDSWCTGHRLNCGRSCDRGSISSYSGRFRLHDKTPEPPCVDTDSYKTHLLNWLGCDANEPFMITGKPGSGKSTFMKFITGHARTRRALKNWAGGHRLVVAKFFFWSSGSPMQRSQDGLLRCLLYQILSQAPDTIPSAVPQRWRPAAGQLRTTEPWTRREISEAFSNLVSGRLLNAKFCFFIDGLDEYGGSDLGSGESNLSLASQFKKLNSSPHIKLCLSSRPRKVFQDHLISDESHHITLQNHTTKDIEQFVQSRFECVEGLIDIKACDLEELQRMIVERSSGVFLWVVLVVGELLGGLEPPFSMPEMKTRLLLLPDNLEGFFQRILDKVHQQYRRFVAQLLLISIKEPNLDLCFVHSLWHLEHNDDVPYAQAAEETAQQRLRTGPKYQHDDITSRIQKTCGDFISVMRPAYGAPYIVHTHRSVAGFLELPGINRQLLALAGWHVQSDVHLTLCRLVISCYRADIITMDDALITRFDDSFASKNGIYTLVRHALLHEHHDGSACSDIIDELDATLCSKALPQVLPEITSQRPYHWTGLVHDLCHPEWAGSEAQFLPIFMTFLGFRLSLKQKLGQLKAEAACLLLDGILRAFLLGCYHFRQPFGGPFFPRRHKVVEFLCVMGADINSVAHAPFASETGKDTQIDVGFDTLAITEGARKCSGRDIEHPQATNTSRTIWEMYLRERRFSERVWVFEEYEPIETLEKLIEAGANLECELPSDCENIQQAMEKRIEAEFTQHETPAIEVREKMIKDARKRIRAALLKQGIKV